MNIPTVSGYVLMVAGLLLFYFNHGLFSFSPVVIALQGASFREFGERL